MLFSSILFLVWFLPLTTAVYFLVPKACRNGVLLAASLLFYGWGNPSWLLLIGADVLVGYLCGLWMERSSSTRGRKTALVCGIVFCVGLLFWFKYYNFFASQLMALTSIDLLVRSIVLPAGISFYTFQVISYLADVYRGTAPVQRSLLKFALYVCMYFQLIAGPIVRYSQIDQELSSRSTSWSEAGEGVRRFLCGLSKKVLLANPLSAVSAFVRTSSEPTVLLFWINAVCVSLFIYYDFSGYSDMAIGLGKIMGFHLPKNFRYPFMAGNFTDFWRCWHMTLTGWFRDYVYIPLGGNRKGIGRQVFNLLVVWMLTGLWHGAAWNFVFWGLLFFVLLCLEKFILPASWIRSWAYRIVFVIVILLSFLLFYDSSLGQFGYDLQAMFGLASLPFSNTQTLYVLRSVLVLLVVSIIGSTPLPARLTDRLSMTRGWWIVPLVSVGALLLCLASLAAGTFNPFLYFQF